MTLKQSGITFQEMPEPSPYIHESLDTIENLYQEGALSYAELVTYIRHWNSFYLVKRTTQAVFASGAVRVFDPELSGNTYGHLKKEFNLAYQF